jgi:hypothetical protein
MPETAFIRMCVKVLVPLRESLSLGRSDIKMTDLVALEFQGHTHVSWPIDCPVKLMTAYDAVASVEFCKHGTYVWPVWSEMADSDTHAHLLVASYQHNQLTIFDPFSESVGAWMSDYPILHNLWRCLGEPKPYNWVYGLQRNSQRDCARRSFNYLEELCGAEKV